MRLNTKHKQKLTKTEKTKKANREKKSKGPKLLENYKSMNSYNNDAITLPITKMTYGLISQFDLVELVTSDGVISMQYSWLQCILVMLDTVITNNPNKFKELLSEYEVTNQCFMVDSLYGKYSMDDNYKAYKIFDKDYYLETTLTPGVIFDAIVGLIKSLELPLDAIQFHMINKAYKDLNTRFSNVTSEETILNLKDSKKLVKKKTHLEFISVLDEKAVVHRIDVALLAFCNIIYDKFGMQKMLMLPKLESTGITIFDPEEPNPNVMPIRGSMVAVYSDGDALGIYEFMMESSKILGFKDDDIKLKFRILNINEPRHEWEVD